MVAIFFFINPIKKLFKKLFSCCKDKNKNTEEEFFCQDNDNFIGEETDHIFEVENENFVEEKGKNMEKENYFEEIEKKNEIVKNQEMIIKKLVKEMEELRNKLKK
jgi:hypothetical protein